MNIKDLDLIEGLIKRAEKKLPKHFDESLRRGYCRLMATKDDLFFETRSQSHIIKILLSQYFLQKKIKKALIIEKDSQRSVIAKIFKVDSKICTSIVLTYDRHSEFFNKKDILKVIQDNITGIKEIPSSFYTWQSVEESYLFCYLEIQKIRGKGLTFKEIKDLQITLERQIPYAVKCFCPEIFRPYHYEEAFRQLNTLKKELSSEDDIPQLSISFKGQSSSSLEFIVHMAYPKKKDILTKITTNLPSFVSFVLHTNFVNPGDQFAASIVFSVYFSIDKVVQPINLLSVRRSITVLLEDIIGPYRDFNGGLLIKQEDIFEKIKLKFSPIIANFNYFASRLFYSLKPIETQLTIEMSQAEVLFKTFSKVVQSNKSQFFLRSGKVFVIKTNNDDLLKSYLKQIRVSDKESYAYLEINNTKYLAILESSGNIIDQIIKNFSLPTTSNKSHKKTLRLAFNEGAPATLNPCYIYSDVRCSTIYRALFEGLTRVDKNGQVLLAAAESYEVSADGRIYYFKLRSNRWSNGEKVTAFHFEKSWKENICFNKEFFANEFSAIKNGTKILNGLNSQKTLGVLAVDENTLEIKLSQPDEHFLSKLSKPLFYPSYDMSKEPSVFNGSFIVSEFNSRFLKLEKNPYFWDKKNIYFDFINILFISNPSSLYSHFEEAKIDWIGAPLAHVPLHMEKKIAEKGILQKRNASHTYWLYINNKQAHLKSKHIRKALSLCLDREKIYKDIYSEKPLSFPFSEKTHFENIDYSPKRAKQHFKIGLKEANLSLKEFPLIELSYFLNPKMKDLAEYIAKTWESTFKIKVCLLEKDWNSFRNSLENGQFQVGGCFEMSYFPSFYNSFQKFSYIDGSYVSENSLLMKNVCNFLKQKKEKYLTAALELFAEELLAIPLFDGLQKYSSNPAVSGYIFDDVGGIDFSRAYLKKNREVI